jgi:hypothetical protein
VLIYDEKGYKKLDLNFRTVYMFSRFFSIVSFTNILSYLSKNNDISETKPVVSVWDIRQELKVI